VEYDGSEYANLQKVTCFKCMLMEFHPVRLVAESVFNVNWVSHLQF
jgi:hypothetical protein